MVEKRKTFKELEQGMGLAKDEAQGSMVLRMSPPPPTEARPAKPASLFEGKAEKALEVPGPITPTKIIDDAGIFDDGIVWEDDAGVFDFVGEDHDEMEAMVAGTPIRIKKTKPESKEALDLIKAFEEGFKGSSTGLALFKEEPKQRQMVFAEEVAATMGHMLGPSRRYWFHGWWWSGSGHGRRVRVKHGD